ncbi:MAG TPA: discoidin domain-containing protein [Microlunatus sp.]
MASILEYHAQSFTAPGGTPTGVDIAFTTTPEPGDLVFVVFAITATGGGATPSVTGLGATYTIPKQIVFVANQKFWLFVGTGANAAGNVRPSMNAALTRDCRAFAMLVRGLPSATFYHEQFSTWSTGDAVGSGNSINYTAPAGPDTLVLGITLPNTTNTFPSAASDAGFTAEDVSFSSGLWLGVAAQAYSAVDHSVTLGVTSNGTGQVPIVVYWIGGPNGVREAGGYTEVATLGDPSAMAVDAGYTEVATLGDTPALAVDGAYAEVLSVAPVLELAPDEATWDARDITGLSNGAVITSWVDPVSGHVAADATGPTYQTNVVNGLPVARFNGFQSLLTDMAIWSGPITVTAVIKMATTANNQNIIGNSTSNAGFEWRIDSLKQVVNQQNTLNVMSPARQTLTLKTTEFAVISLKWVPASRYREAVPSSALVNTVSSAGVYATNGDTSTFWQTSAPANLRMKPLVATAHIAYTITPRAGFLGNAPTAWTLQGSMGGYLWTTLDTRSGITWPTAAAQTFSFTNTTPYAYYRINITTPATLHICDVQLGSTPVRTGHFIVFQNGRNNGWGVRDTDQHVQFSEAVPWSMSRGADGGSRLNADLAYLRIIKGEIDDDVVKARDLALASTYGISSTATIPMTGSVSASSQFVSETAAMGADNNTGTFWTTNNVVAASYQFALPAAIVVASYSVMRRPEPWELRNIKDWTFEGSNNGSSWTTLETRTGVTWPTAGLDVKTFTFANTTPYRYYRINITANQGATYTSFTEAWLNVASADVPVEQPLARLSASVYSAEWKAMFLTDGQVGANNVSAGAGAPPPWTISAGTSRPSYLGSYALVARSDAPGSTPNAWTLEGSNDGNSWAVIDSQSGLSWAAAESKSFSVAGVVRYEQYRWVCTATQTGGATWPAVSELYSYAKSPSSMFIERSAPFPLPAPTGAYTNYTWKVPIATTPLPGDHVVVILEAVDLSSNTFLGVSGLGAAWSIVADTGLGSGNGHYVVLLGKNPTSAGDISLNTYDSNWAIAEAFLVRGFTNPMLTVVTATATSFGTPLACPAQTPPAGAGVIAFASAGAAGGTWSAPSPVGRWTYDPVRSRGSTGFGTAYAEVPASVSHQISFTPGGNAAVRVSQLYISEDLTVGKMGFWGILQAGS